MEEMDKKSGGRTADIVVHGLTQNNLKHVTFSIPKEKITVFTGVSGSGKSSIVLCHSKKQTPCYAGGEQFFR